MRKLLLCFSLLFVIGGTYCLNTLADEESVETSYDTVNTIIEPFDTYIIEDSIDCSDTKVADKIVEEIQAEEELDIYEIKSQEVLQKQEELKSISDNKEWFIAYKELINEYSEWIDPPESIYDVYTSNEIYLMQRCIETETFEQSFNSKVNVASVILNRIESGEFGDDVNDIITPGQFAYGRKNISEDTVLALEYAYMIGDTTNGSLYFHSMSYRPRFSGASYVFTDDAGHHFYK